MMGFMDGDNGDGVLLGMSVKENMPVFHDRFNPGAMNAHMVVMAGNSADQVLFTKLMVVREVRRGVPVYLVDSEGRYGAVTRALGGEVLRVGSLGCGLNPFAVPRTNDADVAKRIAGLCSLVEVMVGWQVELDMDLKSVIVSTGACWVSKWNLGKWNLGKWNLGKWNLLMDRACWEEGVSGPSTVTLSPRVVWRMERACLPVFCPLSSREKAGICLGKVPGIHW